MCVNTGEKLGKTCGKLAENKQAYLNKKVYIKKWRKDTGVFSPKKKMNTYE